jgi:hypothetical protein
VTRFCVISRDYEHHVPREHNPDEVSSTSIHRGLESLSNQTFKDFNVVICHDGPKKKTYKQDKVDFNKLGLTPHLINTKERFGVWGHNSADLAMRYAYENNLGDYYIHHNIDNEFFPEAFQLINNAIETYNRNVIIFEIYHWKIYGKEAMDTPWTGLPPVRQSIDSMQLVAHKDIWKEIGFWNSKEKESDGILYEDICRRFSYHHIPIVLGHNF